MEVNNQSDMAKLLQALINGVDSDEVFEYSEHIEAGECVVNTIPIRDNKTGKSYLVNVKLVK